MEKEKFACYARNEDTNYDFGYGTVVTMEEAHARELMDELRGASLHLKKFGYEARRINALVDALKLCQYT